MKPKIIYQVWGIGIGGQDAWTPKPLYDFETLQAAADAIASDPPTRDLSAGVYVWKKNSLINNDLWIQQAWTLA